ncbi:hypothetical protein [Flavobacterium granuli]|uniref:TetR family transcriptional regulator n=1 Tax=Flavobacterium granuli TaxID=280093 RepID=A0ABU1S2E9_9FLAO|nr:hypothetical protein [Flavobacterium granuli]MDR6844830.1 hypothetical protein [Flavobacterium granuli]
MKTTMLSGVTNGMFLLNNYSDSQTPIIESIIETIVEPIIFKC